MRDFDPAELVDVEFSLQLGSGSMRSKLPVPSGEVTLTELLPILQNFTSGIAQHAAGRMAQQGQPVTCGPRCAACCYQLVPISPFEAEGLAQWIRSLPAEQQHALAARFYRALRALQEHGVLAKLTPQMFALTADEMKQIGIEYFQAAVPCPFLEEENCSIHPIRPLVCREYMVVSPPIHCAEPGHRSVLGVSLPVRPSNALMRLAQRVPGDSQGRLPLIFLFQWMAAGIEAGASVAGSGPSVLREFVEALAGGPASA